jgi:diguanylate cyclase (GGDEF)-like protein/PAS domain S-box-containing protein
MDTTPPDPRTRPPSADELAYAWAQAIRDTSFVDMNFVELRAFLRRLAERLLAPVAERAPRAVGAALVEAHFTRVESLERTLDVLARELPGPQLGAILAGLATGYAEALRELTRAEQQRIIAAALLARQQAEDARWASEARFAAVFSEAPIGIGVSTVDGELLEINGFICDLLGYPREQLLKWTQADFAHPDDPVGVEERYAELIAGSRDYFRIEKPFLRADGTVVWTDMVVSLIRDKHGSPCYVVGMVEDITERYDLHLRLRHQAMHDPLTGLSNRSRFFQQLEGILSAAQPTDKLGLLYLDIDGFKAVNDTLGHDVGDELIRTIGARLGELGAGTTLVARTGGDEFVVLIPGADRAAAVAVAERVLAAVRIPVGLRGQSVAVSASIGVVAGPVGQATAADLMRAADTTLYWAKSQGRNRLALFDADRHIREVTRYELTASLPDALARGELFLEYQPLIRLRDDQLVGVEALVRWAHPRWGILGPDHFISLAEEHGLIEPLGAWVLAEACNQAARWRADHPDRPLLMSVNLAPHQVRAAELPDKLAGLLGSTGLAPELLQLELTESAVMASAGVPLATLNALAAMGCRIAIDDFGTGYSNLAYLRTLPVHAVKLAGPFVAGLRAGVGPTDRAIVDTLIRLSHTLDLSVTAEGVETATQADALRKLGCDLAQGYHYGAPMGADAISARLRGGPDQT